MTDHEIFDVLDKAIERYSKTTNEFIAIELDSVRHEMKGLKEEFRAMNGRLREVCAWKDQHEGEMKAQEKSISKHIQIAGVIIAFISVVAVMYVNFNKVGKQINIIEKSVLLQNEMTLENRGFAPTGPVRGDTTNVN